MPLNIEAITASFGPLLAGDLSAVAPGDQPPALNFANLLATQVLAAGEAPAPAAAGRLLGLPLLAADSPGAQVLRFDQLVELLTDPPAAAPELTLDLPQEASTETDPLALITLTQMMSLLHNPSPLSTPGLIAPVEARLEIPGPSAGPEHASLEEGQISPALVSLPGLSPTGELMNSTGLVTLTGNQPQPAVLPSESQTRPELNGSDLTVTVTKPVVVAGKDLAAETPGPEAAAIEAAATEAGDFEHALRTKAALRASAAGEVKPEQVAGSTVKDNAPAGPAPQPKIDLSQETAWPNLRAVPDFAPANPLPNVAAVQAPADLPDLPALQQVIDTVEFLSQQGETEVRLHLYPKELGQLHVHLQVIEGQVVVRMVAESSQAQNLIQDHLVQLKAAFSAQGLQVDQMTVNVGNGGAEANPFGQPSRNSFAQPDGAQPLALPGQVAEQIQPEPRKSRVWGLVHSVDYKI
jgi:hypothetical protein